MVAGLRTQMDTADLERAWTGGRAMTMEQAIMLALAAVDTDQHNGGNEHDLAPGA